MGIQCEKSSATEEVNMWAAAGLKACVGPRSIRDIPDVRTVNTTKTVVVYHNSIWGLSLLVVVVFEWIEDVLPVEASWLRVLARPVGRVVWLHEARRGM
jgi:hypothetical protein